MEERLERFSEEWGGEGGGVSGMRFPRLDQDGWSAFETGIENPIDLKEWMLDLSNQLGRVRSSRRGASFVDLLVPTHPSESKPASLSAKYGRGSFPLHCDTAYWTIPCHYIVLGCLNPGTPPVATMFLDTTKLELSEEERALIEQAVYVVRNGRHSFYCGIKGSSHPFFRFDPGCMEPQCEYGVHAMELLSYERNQNVVVRYNWNVGDVLVIDNWRFLHGREPCAVNGEMRKLFRVTVQ